MNRSVKRSMAAAFALIVLGILVLLAGEKSLVVLIPAAVLVWYGTPKLRKGRKLTGVRE